MKNLHDDKYVAEELVAHMDKKIACDEKQYITWIRRDNKLILSTLLGCNKGRLFEELLENVYNFEICDFQYRGMLMLLHKKGDNIRKKSPLTLLNSDYKII